MPYLAACQICLYLGEVVRDHDHRTGKIRGYLCNRCNRFLGVYENRHRFGKVYPTYAPRKRFHRWRRQFHAEIRIHLGRDTGIVYEGDNHPETLPVRVRNVEAPLPPRRKEKPKRGKRAAQPRKWDPNESHGPAVEKLPESKVKRATSKSIAAYRAFVARKR